MTLTLSDKQVQRLMAALGLDTPVVAAELRGDRARLTLLGGRTVSAPLELAEVKAPAPRKRRPARNRGQASLL
ncbi:MAG: hypothetical protein ACRDHL_12585 [Candidatus Promineifilaceae bacterium]